MTLSIKLQDKTFSDDVLFVVASVTNDIGTLISQYALNLPEQSSDDEIKSEILKLYT